METKMKLSDILSNDEIKDVVKFLNKNDMEKLRKYLRDRKDALETKNVYPDYLFYMLQYMRLNKEI